jgi:hypothetical protein
MAPTSKQVYDNNPVTDSTLTSHWSASLILEALNAGKCEPTGPKNQAL